jgi:two-component system nitrogen regulation sensor histidine kinase NtrY
MSKPYPSPSYSIVQSSIGWLRRNLLLMAVLAVCVSLAITYSIIDNAPTNFEMKPKRMMTLLSVNVGLFALIIAIISMRIFWLWRTIRAGSSGSNLQKRIVLMFSLVTISPAIIVSIFSALFFNIGIQTWFNERVQRTVEESRAVAEAYLAEHKENIRADAIAMAGDLGQVADLVISNPAEFNKAVVTQSALRVLTEAVVIQRNRIVAQGRLSFSLAFETIPQDVLDRAASGEVVIMTTDDDKVRALIKIPSIVDGYLMVGRLIDSKVIGHMQSAQGAVGEYENLKNQLDRLQITFSVVFIALALLLLISSVWYGMVFASRLTRPIRYLVQASERVRGGDFSARIEDASSKDEFGTLSRSFNRMTEQLEAQRSELMYANRRLDERRRFTETVLSGVSAGVIALNRDKNLTLYNRSSSAILERVNKTLVEGEHITHFLPDITELLHKAEAMPADVAEGTVTLGNNEKTITLHVRVTVEHLGNEIEGFIVTFDDITQLVVAQRSAAWADVARRVAHEIKNPLTPIQLSAERIKRKYLKFITEDEENFIRYTDTITKHVADIGKMVDEFVSFAKMPATRFMDEDIVLLVRKAVFSAQIACPNYEFQLSLPEKPVFLNCDERQITQVMTNLLKNAAEAIDECGDRDEKGCIKVSVNQDEQHLYIVVEDNGIGFKTSEINKMLEPYVTTRSKGTGLGLSIVKKIVEDHKGLINIENGKIGGAKVTLSFLQHCDIKDATSNIKP